MTTTNKVIRVAWNITTTVILVATLGLMMRAAVSCFKQVGKTLTPTHQFTTIERSMSVYNDNPDAIRDEMYAERERFETRGRTCWPLHTELFDGMEINCGRPLSYQAPQSN